MGTRFGEGRKIQATASLAYSLEHEAVAVMFEFLPNLEGTFLCPSPSSFPLRESIEAYVSDRFICDNINESTFIIKRMSHQGQF